MVWWAAVFALGAVLAAFARYLYLRRAFQPSGTALLEQIRRLRHDQLETLLASLPDGSDAHAVVEAAATNADPETRGIFVDEAMLDVEGKLARGAGMPKTAARVAMLSGNAFAVLELLMSLPSPDMDDLLRIAACLVFGTLGAFAALFCARFASKERGRQADAWYDVARRLAAPGEGSREDSGIPSDPGGQGLVSGRQGG